MKTILLIDDEKSWAEDLVIQLNKFSYNTILATSGREGVEFAQKYLPDLILCDITLPDIDGFDVYEELHRTEFERIAPFIFISGKSDLPSINKQIKSLNCESLTKPVRIKKIIETLDRLIGENVFAKENVLLVSNDNFYKYNLQKSLAIFNYNLLYADTITTFKEITSKEKIKFVLIDLSISESNGLEATCVLKENELLEKLHVIMLDDKFNSKLFNRLIAEGVTDYLIKSYNFDELVKVLKIRSKQEKIKKKIFTNNGAKLLIVEDDNELSKNLEYQLKRTGIQPFFAHSGSEAVELAKTLKPDIILCDIILPDYDGFKVHAELKKLISESQIPFIFQSGKGDWKSFRKALNYGVDGLLIKPYKFKELLSVLKNYIEIKKEDIKSEVKKNKAQVNNDEYTWPDSHPIYETKNNVIISRNLFEQNELAISDIDQSENKSDIKNDSRHIEELNEVKTETKRIIKKKCNLDYSLEHFLNTHDDSKDYDKFIYNDIVIIKINISRAVLREAQHFYKYIFDLIIEGHNKFVIDLNSVEFIDSTFIGVLVSALKRISFNRGELKLVCNPELSTSSYVMFDGLKNIFDIFNDIREVVDAYQQHLVN